MSFFARIVVDGDVYIVEKVTSSRKIGKSHECWIILIMFFLSMPRIRN